MLVIVYEFTIFTTSLRIQVSTGVFYVALRWNRIDTGSLNLTFPFKWLYIGLKIDLKNVGPGNNNSNDPEEGGSEVDGDVDLTCNDSKETPSSSSEILDSDLLSEPQKSKDGSSGEESEVFDISQFNKM